MPLTDDYKDYKVSLTLKNEAEAAINLDKSNTAVLRMFINHVINNDKKKMGCYKAKHMIEDYPELSTVFLGNSL